MQATAVKLDEMSVDQLHELQDRLVQTIHERNKEERREKRKKMKELAKELGYSVEREAKPKGGKARRSA